MYLDFFVSSDKFPSNIDNWTHLHNTFGRNKIENNPTVNYIPTLMSACTGHLSPAVDHQRIKGYLRSFDKCSTLFGKTRGK